MFSKKSLHVTLAFVLLIGLAAMGIAYGAWTDQLIITGKVNTGTFDIQVSGAVLNDSDGAAANGGSCSLVHESTAPDTWKFEMVNGYPGFSCTVHTEFANVGGFKAAWTPTVQAYSLDGAPVAFSIDPTPAIPSNPIDPGYTAVQDLTFTVNQNAGMSLTQFATIKVDFTQVIPVAVP